MMRRLAVPLAARAARSSPAARTTRDEHTLAELRNVQPDVQEVQVEKSLDQAMAGYRRFLEETPESALTPEAMRRLADLKIEKQFGIRAATASRARWRRRSGRATPRTRSRSRDGRRRGRARPTSRSPTRSSSGARPRRARSRGRRRARARARCPSAPGDADPPGPLEAIALYDQLLAEYPTYEHNDQVLYQKARAYDELGRTDEAIADDGAADRRVPALRGTTTRCSSGAPSTSSRAASSATPRRPTRRSPASAPRSAYYELALYKLGWTLYKQDFYEEALHKYMALLDYKVSIGYDFDQAHDEDDERRIADTFRVISLSFSNLGGPEVVQEYFARVRPPRLRGPHLQQPRRVLPRQAPLRRRRQDLQGVRRALSVPPRVAALQHARDRDLRRRATSRSSCSSRRRTFAATLRAAVRVLAALQAARNRPRSCSYLKSQPEGPREPLPRAVPGRGSSRTRSPRTTPRRCAGTATTSLVPERRRSRRRSTTSSPTCCSSTRTSARRRAVRAHGLRLSRRTRSRPPPATRRSTPTAST